MAMVDDALGGVTWTRDSSDFFPHVEHSDCFRVFWGETILRTKLNQRLTDDLSFRWTRVEAFKSASLVVVLLSVLALSRARSALVVVREAIASDGM